MVWHCSSSEKRWQARECKPLIGLGFGMDQKLPGGDEHADMPAILGLGYQGYPVRYIVLWNGGHHFRTNLRATGCTWPSGDRTSIKKQLEAWTTTNYPEISYRMVPPIVSWFITPTKYSYIYQQP
jgi:hypothetical protein